MIKRALTSMTEAELVAEFLQLALAQDKTIDDAGTRRYNRFFDKLRDVELELQSRLGDRRRDLLALYTYPNWQVRLVAAFATLAVAPKESREALQSIVDSKQSPQAGNAASTLGNLKRGFFTPT